MLECDQLLPGLPKSLPHLHQPTEYVLFGNHPCSFWSKNSAEEFFAQLCSVCLVVDCMHNTDGKVLPSEHVRLVHRATWVCETDGLWIGSGFLHLYSDVKVELVKRIQKLSMARKAGFRKQVRLHRSMRGMDGRYQH